jgi:deoxyribose-phosphate aldolase
MSEERGASPVGDARTGFGAATSDAATARRILALLDLTELTDSCTESSIDQLVARAVTPQGKVAAVCLWPRFVKQAREALVGTGVKIATVMNFPGGNADIGRVVDDMEDALADGADEIDVVMPYRAFLAGDEETARALLRAARRHVPAAHRLKVILETGAYSDPRLVAKATRLAVEEGADFVKTSTGKWAISATLPAAEAMLQVIRSTGASVGVKPSGGIRTLADARPYLELADRLMGLAWASPETFRIGASGLHSALIAAIDGAPAARPADGY